MKAAGEMLPGSPSKEKRKEARGELPRIVIAVLCLASNIAVFCVLSKEAPVPTTTAVANHHHERKWANDKNESSSPVVDTPHCLAPTEYGRSAGVPSRRRLAAMSPIGTNFSYVHIAKCAGGTFVTLLNDLNIENYPEWTMGREHSVWYQNNTAYPNADYVLTALRSPRHHVFSMFAHIKYFRQANSTLPPVSSMNNTGRLDDEVEFSSWLDDYLPMGVERTRDMRHRYHPANFQSRQLTSHARTAKVVTADDPPEPDYDLAMRTYRALDYVGLADFVHESRCLLYYRLGCDAPPAAVEYLDVSCRCVGGGGGGDDDGNVTNGTDDMTAATSRAGTGGNDVIVTHKPSERNWGHRPVLRDLPAETLDKVGRLTAVDSRLYVTALREFAAEVAWLESRHALGRRVMCDDALGGKEPELRYLGVSVTDIYRDATAKEAREGGGGRAAIDAAASHRRR